MGNILVTSTGTDSILEVYKNFYLLYNGITYHVTIEYDTEKHEDEDECIDSFNSNKELSEMILFSKIS